MLRELSTVFQQIFENQILKAAKLKHPKKYKKLVSAGIPIKLRSRYFVMFQLFCCCPIYILDNNKNMTGSKNMTGCMVLECIAMSVLSSIFNLSKNFRTSNFRVSNLALKICNFISVSQIQITENANNLNNVESYILAGNYRQLTILGKTELRLTELGPYSELVINTDHDPSSDVKISYHSKLFSTMCSKLNAFLAFE